MGDASELQTCLSGRDEQVFASAFPSEPGVGPVA
jgi:hypothetical protein